MHHPAPAHASRLGFDPSPRASLRSIPARVSRASRRPPAHLPPPLPPLISTSPATFPVDPVDSISFSRSYTRGNSVPSQACRCGTGGGLHIPGTCRLVLFPGARNAARPLHHQHLPDPYIISTSPATIPAALSPISHFPLAVLLGSQAGQIASAHHPAPAYGESYASRLGFGPSPRASLRSIPARVSRASCRPPAHLPPPLPPPSSAPPPPPSPSTLHQFSGHTPE